MKTLITLCLCMLLYTNTSQAQSEIQHKIIFQLVSGDTAAHKVLMKQFGNILSVAPNTKIEVVCQGPGLEMMMQSKTVVANKIKAFKEKGVIFNVCEFSMKDRNVDKSKMLEEASFVPAGIIEIVTKQEEGWSYIKAGF